MSQFNRCRRRCKDSVRGGQALLSENAVCVTVGTGSFACRKPFSPSPSSRHSLLPRLPAPVTCRCTCARSRSVTARSPAVQPARHFNMLAVHWIGTGAVAYRTRNLHGTWRPWRDADADNRTGAWHDGNLDWTGASGGLQFRVGGAVRRLRSYEVWSRVTGAPVTRALAGRHARDRHARCLGRERGDRARPAVVRAGGAARRDPPHGRQRTRTRARRPRRSCAGSRSTTCRETVGTTSATTFSSTASARSTKVAAAASSGT